jgi:AAT family amino acid transporter/D-serine/D-alanine/glycine transporter
MKKSLDDEQLRAQEDLHRGLKDRHVQMIAIGGTIGVGLFLGSAMAIQKAHGAGGRLPHARLAVYELVRGGVSRPGRGTP